MKNTVIVDARLDSSISSLRRFLNNHNFIVLSLFARSGGNINIINSATVLVSAEPVKVTVCFFKYKQKN